jgi:hypothetical protein
LKGIYKEQLAKSIEESTVKLGMADFRICLSGDEWEHDLDASNWNENFIETITAANILEAPFCKIASSIPLHKWQHIVSLLEEKHQLLDAVMGNQLPKR